jgi:dihydrofolate synthase / folylpolyglutamate synthase
MLLTSQGVARSRNAPFYRVHDLLRTSNSSSSSSSSGAKLPQLDSAVSALLQPPAAAELDDFDADNSALATAAALLLPTTRPHLAVPTAALVKAMQLRPPCRFQVLTVHTTPAAAAASSAQQQQQQPVTVVLDVAHNPPAMARLLHKLRNSLPQPARFRFVLGLSRDKDCAACLAQVLQALQGRPEAVHFVAAAHPRATPVPELIVAFEALVAEKLPELRNWRYSWPTAAAASDSDSNVRAGVAEALQAAAAANAAVSSSSSSSSGSDEDAAEVVVVCGSVFLMADARQELGFNEPQVCSSAY